MRNWHGNLSPFGSWHTGRRVFNPLSLFANGEPGVWFDPSPTTTFTDTAGTTPATVGSAVALMLDKSKGLALGPELGNAALLDKRPATDGTVTRSGGIITFTSAASGLSIAISQEITGLTIGRTYRFDGRMRRTVGATACLPQIRTADGGGGSGLLNGPNIGSDFTSFSLLWVATQTSAHFSFSAGANSQTIEVDEAAFSVRELPGNHATQSITTARPILARVPASGRRNLLTFTDSLIGNGWVGSLGVTAAVSGEETHITNLNLGDTDVGWGRSVTLAPTTATFSLTLRGEGSNIGKAARLRLKRQGGTFIAADTDVVLTASPQRISVTLTMLGDNTGVQCIITRPSTNIADAVFVSNPQLEVGSTATAYQRVGSTFDVTEAGKADLYHLVFDGTDDWLVTPTITPGTDKAQIFAGVRKLSDAAAGIIAETSIDAPTNNGTFFLLAPADVATGNYGFFVKGTGIPVTSVRAATFNAPISNVVTGIADISAPERTLRVNGSQITTSSTALGATDFSNHPLYIGRRAGTSVPFNGHLYSLIVRFGANLDAGTISATERYVGGKTGVVLP